MPAFRGHRCRVEEPSHGEGHTFLGVCGHAQRLGVWLFRVPLRWATAFRVAGSVLAHPPSKPCHPHIWRNHRFIGGGARNRTGVRQTVWCLLPLRAYDHLLHDTRSRGILARKFGNFLLSHSAKDNPLFFQPRPNCRRTRLQFRRDDIRAQSAGIQGGDLIPMNISSIASVTCPLVGERLVTFLFHNQTHSFLPLIGTRSYIQGWAAVSFPRSTTDFFFGFFRVRPRKPLTTTANVVTVLGVLRTEEGDEIPFISIEFGSGCLREGCGWTNHRGVGAYAWN